MRNFTLLILCAALAGFIVSCKKEDGTNPNVKIIGRWLVNGQFVVTGDFGHWDDTGSDPDRYVQFHLNRKMDGTVYPGFSAYEIKGSNALLMTNASSDSVYYNYIFRQDTLYLSPTRPGNCVGSCSIRFVKRK